MPAMPLNLIVISWRHLAMFDPFEYNLTSDTEISSDTVKNDNCILFFEISVLSS